MNILAVQAAIMQSANQKTYWPYKQEDEAEWADVECNSRTELEKYFQEKMEADNMAQMHSFHGEYKRI